MRVDTVEIHPAGSSDVAVMSLRDPGRKNPYNVKALIGLDADEIIPRYYGGSGSKFYNLSLEKREVIIRIQLNPRFGEDETYSDLRSNLYKMIASARTGLIQLQFKNKDEIIAAISGFVIKFEVPHASKVPELQITIRCDDPMLRALEHTEVNTTQLNQTIFNIIDPKSTAPHGLRFSVGVLASVGAFKMYDPDDDSWSFDVQPQSPFLVGDIIHFSSEHNNKHLYISRQAEKIHIAESIIPGSIWPILFPGDNFYSLENQANFQWIGASYFPTYWGV